MKIILAIHYYCRARGKYFMFFVILDYRLGYIHSMETVLRVSPRGLTDVMCNFGSGVSAMSGFSLFTRYALLIFSL